MKLGHLLKTSVPHLPDLLNIKSCWLVLWLVEDVSASLHPEALRVFAVDSSDLRDNDCEYVFPSLAVCPAVGQWQPEDGFPG